MLGFCPNEVLAEAIKDLSYIAYVTVDTIDELHADFKNRGLSLLEDALEKPLGVRQFLVTTPDGNRIMFGQDLE